MAKLSDFLPYVLPYVSGCSDPLAEQFIRDVCIDFCAKTLIVQQTLDPITAVQNIDTYDLDAPVDTQIHTITRAWYEQRPLTTFNNDSRQTHPELYNKHFTGADNTPGTPSGLYFNQDSTFTLNVPPFQTSGNAITVKAALKPTRTATTVDDILLNEYAYEIGQGVVGRLVLLPNTDFTAPALSAAYTSVYVGARNAARIRANKGFGRSESRVQFQRFI